MQISVPHRKRTKLETHLCCIFQHILNMILKVNIRHNFILLEMIVLKINYMLLTEFGISS